MLDSDDDIHGLLTRVAAPAPNIDVADVVAQGRRRRSRRRLVGTAATISLVLLLAATSLVVARTTRHAEPAKPRTCTAAPLPMPAGYDRGAYTGIDPTGRYILGKVHDSHDLDQVAKTGDVQVLWTDGEPKVMSIPARQSNPSLRPTLKAWALA